MWHIKHYFKLHWMFQAYEICRDAMHSGCSEDDLLALVGAAVRRKKQQHAGKQQHTITHTVLQLRHHHLYCALPVKVCAALISFLMPCNKVLLKKLTVTQLVKKLSASNGARRFVTPLLPLDSVLGQMNPLHTLRSYVIVYYSPIYAYVSHVASSLRVYPLKYFTYFYSYPCVLHVSPNSHSIIWTPSLWRVWIMIFLIFYLSAACCSSSHLGPNILLSTLFLYPHDQCPYPKVTWNFTPKSHVHCIGCFIESTLSPA